MDVHPHELSEILVILKEHRVRRARLDGIGEFEFEESEPEFVAEKEVELERVEPVHVPAPQAPVKSGVPNGYAKLFGGQFPAFKKPTEPQE